MHVHFWFSISLHKLENGIRNRFSSFNEKWKMDVHIPFSIFHSHWKMKITVYTRTRSVVRTHFGHSMYLLFWLPAFVVCRNGSFIPVRNMCRWWTSHTATSTLRFCTTPSYCTPLHWTRRWPRDWTVWRDCGVSFDSQKTRHSVLTCLCSKRWPRDWTTAAE